MESMRINLVINSAREAALYEALEAHLKDVPTRYRAAKLKEIIRAGLAGGSLALTAPSEKQLEGVSGADARVTKRAKVSATVSTRGVDDGRGSNGSAEPQHSLADGMAMMRELGVQF